MVLKYDRKLCFTFKVSNRIILDITFLFQYLYNSHLFGR
uniref:Uncharacterized protein n=1 Tax=Candidatus Kentrum sp. FM TaxID=2126340 RepID=A0A450S1S8_9GAMM|nr:MAG: hypothetical protein BECKFM1743A_GA0114220_1001114 [Candidatus Kentron sp. FM]VFJ45598.1 MAG: hypothetical protein BECKFM1743C_GA0114222_1002715 [Candidatus Kentron sp. FM]VFK06947.1 MAG: hypothetical protein BECKFM1743B_GA0114221_100287 [Candidatus Kentron sp. FM]